MKKMPFRSDNINLNERRISGHIDREKMRYVTHRKRERHFFRIFNGYGISMQVLVTLQKNRIDDILLIEKDDEGNEQIYKTTVKEMLELGSEWIDNTHTRKPEKQIVLEINKWRR